MQLKNIRFYIDSSDIMRFCPFLFYWDLAIRPLAYEYLSLLNCGDLGLVWGIWVRGSPSGDWDFIVLGAFSPLFITIQKDLEWFLSLCFLCSKWPSDHSVEIILRLKPSNNFKLNNPGAWELLHKKHWAFFLFSSDNNFLWFLHSQIYRLYKYPITKVGYVKPSKPTAVDWASRSYPWL